MTRPYTGFDKNATGKRAGTEKFVELLCAFSGGALWNNGTWGIRNMRGKKVPSVHGTGRAMDLSYRKTGANGVPNGRAKAVEMMQFLVDNADLLGVEAVLDYAPKPFGRGFRCDRDGWIAYKKPVIQGAPGGDWVHVEISNQMADNPKKVGEAFFKATNGVVGSAKTVVDDQAEVSADPVKPKVAKPTKKA